MNKVVVVGSLNIDIVQDLERLPKSGETMAINNQSSNFGGKGANQAVAVARANGDVSFIGAVGDDEKGKAYKELLVEENISVEHISSKKKPTGTAYIMLEPNGDNTILVFAGANGEVTAEDVRNAESIIADADVVVAQLEVPQAAVREAFKIAHEHNVTTILNPAPVTDHVDPEILKNTDLLVPNETEAAALAGVEPSTKVEDLEKIVTKYKDLGIENAVITLGGDGVFYSVNGETGTLPIFKVKAIDTTAAGDTFIGNVAAQIKPDMSNLKDVIVFASRASSLAVSRMGAIASIPTYEETKAALEN